MEKIVKLQLDNNIIVRIQGLDQLVNLRWLDLSFNLIEKIDGLEKNKELEDLSLYNNCITELTPHPKGPGPLDNLVKLNVLSIGKNKITKLEEMLKYLKRFKRLQVLKIEENEFKQEGKSGKDNAYRQKTIAWLQTLVYLDYKIISNEEKVKAVEEMRDQMSSENTGDDNEGKKDEEDEDTIKDLREARIEITHKMVQKIVSQCEQYKNLEGFKQLKELITSTEGNIEGPVQLFQGQMRTATKQRNAVIKVMQERMIAAERKAEEDSIEKIDTYQKYEKQKYREIERERLKNDKNLLDYRPFEDDLLKKVETLQGDLLEIEIKLQHALKGNQDSA